MKYCSLLSLVVSILLLSCNTGNENKELTDKKTSKSNAESPNVLLIKEFFTHFNNHEWEKMAGLYTDPAEFKDPSFGNGVVKQARTEIIRKYTDLNSVFKDIQDQVVAIYPSGEKNVIVEFISSGTAPDGLKFELPICTIFTIEAGLITKDFTYYDNFEAE